MSSLQKYSMRKRKTVKRPHSPEFEEPSPSRLRKLDDQNALRFEDVFHNCRMLEEMFKYLSVDDLRVMSQTNKQISSLILTWIQTTKAHPTILFPSLKPDPLGGLIINICEDPKRSDDDWPQHFVNLGRLLKSLTCLQPISQRLMIGNDVIMQLHRVTPSSYLKMMPGHEYCTLSTCDWRLDSNLLKCVAKFAYSFIKGWSQKNLDIAFVWLVENANYKYHICKQLTVLWTGHDYVWGSNSVMEYRLRQQLLHLFWIEVPKSMQGMWLSKVLHTFSKDQVYQKALLLYLMFGPMRKGQYSDDNNGINGLLIMWEQPDDHKNLDEEFNPLAHALSSLYDEGCLEYKVMTYLFRDPNACHCNDHDTHLSDWTNQSMAQLLLMMSPNSRKWFLKQRLHDENGDRSEEEVPGVLAHLILVASSLNYEMKPIFDLISNLYSRSAFCEGHKRTMIEMIWNELTEHLQAVTTVDIQIPADNLRVPVMKAIRLLGRHLMNMAYCDGGDNRPPTMVIEE